MDGKIKKRIHQLREKFFDLQSAISKDQIELSQQQAHEFKSAFNALVEWIDEEKIETIKTSKKSKALEWNFCICGHERDSHKESEGKKCIRRACGCEEFQAELVI